MKFDLSALVAVAAFVALGYLAWDWNAGGRMTLEMQPGRLVVASERYRFEYELDPDESTTSGVLTMADHQSGVSEGGALLTLHYLSEDSMAEFRRTENPETCLAPFFNRYAQHKILIPADAEIENKLRAIDLSDYRKPVTWRRFTARGRCISSAPVVSMDGQPGRLPTNMFDECLSMVVTGLDVRDDPVELH